MSWSQVSAQDVQSQPWKNGGGKTRELLAWPHPAEWLLRVSVADIEASGPFSSFPGVQRWFAVLRGAGVRLYDYVLSPDSELLSFDGSLGPDCELLKGPTLDFNLMHRRGHGRVEVAEAGSQPCALSGRLMLLFTSEGGVLDHGGRRMELPPLSLAWCEEPAAQPLRFEGRGAAWWISWSAAA